MALRLLLLDSVRSRTTKMETLGTARRAESVSILLRPAILHLVTPTGVYAGHSANSGGRMSVNQMALLPGLWST